jgi:hypothetical protein
VEQRHVEDEADVPVDGTEERVDGTEERGLRLLRAAVEELPATERADHERARARLDARPVRVRRAKLRRQPHQRRRGVVAIERAVDEIGDEWSGRVELRLIGPTAPFDFLPEAPNDETTVQG